MVNKGPSHQGAKMGRGPGTDQAFQELSPHVLQTIGHRCERDRLSSFWCVFHVRDLPAERQRRGPKLKAEVDAGPRVQGPEKGGGWERAGSRDQTRGGGAALIFREIHPPCAWGHRGRCPFLHSLLNPWDTSPCKSGRPAETANSAHLAGKAKKELRKRDSRLHHSHSRLKPLPLSDIFTVLYCPISERWKNNIPKTLQSLDPTRPETSPTAGLFNSESQLLKFMGLTHLVRARAKTPSLPTPVSSPRDHPTPSKHRPAWLSSHVQRHIHTEHTRAGSRVQVHMQAEPRNA